MVFGFFFSVCSQFSFTYSQNDTKFWRYVLFFSVQKWNSERFSHLPFLFPFRLIQILSIDFYVYVFVPSADCRVLLYCTTKFFFIVPFIHTLPNRFCLSIVVCLLSHFSHIHTWIRCVQLELRCCCWHFFFPPAPFGYLCHKFLRSYRTIKNNNNWLGC